jgi:hypothetical protein
MNQNISYTYLIGWKSQDKWYYGVRYSSKCHPNDLWKKYFTSSKKVKSFRENHGEPDIIEIRKTFLDPKKAKLWEERVLRRMKVSKKDQWLNLREDTWKGVVITDDIRNKMSIKAKGNSKTKGYTNEFRLKNGYKLIPGKPKGSKEKEETKIKKSISKTGKVTVLDLQGNCFSVSCDDERYLRGDLTPVNRGVKWKMSDEGKKNISLSCKNREIFYCGECDRNITGKMNWNRHILSNKHLFQSLKTSGIG